MQNYVQTVSLCWLRKIWWPKAVYILGRIRKNILKPFDDKSFSHYLKLGALGDLIPLISTFNLNFQI